jgi:hypothetical protein
VSTLALSFANVVANSAAPTESHPARTILLAFLVIAAAVAVGVLLLAHLRRR